MRFSGCLLVVVVRVLQRQPAGGISCESLATHATHATHAVAFEMKIISTNRAGAVGAEC